MAGWNLALRFGLELAALAGLSFAASRMTDGVFVYVAAIGVPVAAATAWGTFNVVGDPSRSGQAPIPVPGWLRLALELAVLVPGGVAIAIAWRRDVSVAFSILVVIQYAASWARVRWLLEQ